MPKLYIKFLILFAIVLHPCLAKSQVTASFTVDYASGCSPLVVHFMNTSTGATSYSWNLGNTTTSALTNPAASYGAAGVYTVTLTAISGASTSTYTTTITVNPLPTLSFSADDTTVCLGVPITFSNGSSGGMAGAVSYTWNFGDGSTSTVTAPTYTYASPGFYNITLFATNSGGCSRSLTKNSYIQVYTPPVVSFSGTGTYICKPPASVPFTNTSSGTLPLLCNWSFGDGSSPSAAVSPSHIYSATGSYNVRLRVTDGHACIDSAVYPSYVNVSGLHAAFTTPTAVCQGLNVLFTNSSTAHLLSSWDFGDGATSIEDTPGHTYSTAGVYNARLIVYDGSCYDTVIHPVTIAANPAATFTITPTLPCPTTVTINYNATIPSGCTAFWEIPMTPTFTSTSSGVSTTRTYLAPPAATGPIHTVKLTVFNSSTGCITTLFKQDTIYNLNINLAAVPQAGCVPLTTTFVSDISAFAASILTAEIVSLPVPYTFTSFSWNFGDGSPVVTGFSPTHTYTAIGVYNATCTMTTSTGCVRVKTAPVYVGSPPATPSFTATPAHICADHTIILVATAPAPVNSLYWYYGDGTADSGVGFNTVAHYYNNPGVDTVRLRAYYNGCPSLQVKTVVTVDSPNAVPSFDFLCIPNNRVQFGDASLGITSRLWIFGDGDTSSAATPIHDFPALLNYAVKLTTYNAASGCRDTAITVVKLAPPPMFTATTDQTICIHDNAVLFSIVTGMTIERYKWYLDWNLLIDSTLDVVSVPVYTSGLQDLNLVILDERGCFDTLSQHDYILVGNPTDSFTLSPPNGCAPLPVTFTDHSFGIPDCPLVSYAWTFGDGGSMGPTGTPGATHTYIGAGTYNIALTVTDSIGCTSTTDIPAPVTAYRPHASFYASPNNVCLGTNIHFNNTSSTAVSYVWLFGDGTTSTVIAPNHMYTATGIYTVKLVATDVHGCRDTGTLTNYIYIASSPSASFMMSDSFAVCPPLNVHFINTSSGGAISYNWSFGNSASSVAPSPTNPYTAAGYYTVRLVAYNSTGCTDTARRHVNVFGYSGAFSYTPTSGCMPQPVHFSASLGSIASLLWDFGDGYTSTVSMLDTISHVYATQGTYIPKLILTDTSGCTNFSVGADTIKVDKLTPNFRINPNPVCQGSSTVLTDSSYAIYSVPNSWVWSYGSGPTNTGSSATHTFTVAGVQAVTLTATNAFGCNVSVTKNVTVNAIPSPIFGPMVVCVGFTTTLFDTSGAGTWSSSTPSVATVSGVGVVTGMGIGTSRITYTLSAGCISTAVVTVYALPAPITGVNNICEGATTIYNSTTTGGNWTSSAPAIASVHSVTGSINGLAAGTATITYSLGTGCYTTKNITINPVPAPITGVTSLCTTNTTTLFETSTGGAWSSSNVTVAPIDAIGNILGNSAGTSNITYAFSTGCKATTAVTVNPTPDTIAGSPTLCDGQTTNLSNTLPGGFWSSSNTVVAVVHPVLGTVLGMSVGTAVITYAMGTGCRVSKVVSVNTTPSPLVGLGILCVGGSATLIEITPGGSWTSGNTLVGTVDASGNIAGLTAGTAGITYSLSSGCYAAKVVTVQALPSGILGNPQICAGFTSVLSSTTAGGTWTSYDVSVATVTSSGVVTAVSVGTAIVSYTLSSGCATGVVVTVNPIPTPISGVHNACVGVPTPLSSTPTGGWWMSSNITVATIDAFTGIYTGITPGTAGITYTSAAGCTTSTIVSLQPIPPPILGGFTVCTGFALNLTCAMPGGVWSTNPGTAMIGTIHPITGVISGITPGTVVVSYTVMTGCYRDITVTVVPLPPTITGAPMVCVGETTTLGNASTGGLWTTSNPARATVDISTGVVTGVSPGPVVITYTIGSGCFNILHVTVNPVPAPITGPGSVCEGATITLSDPTPSGVWISDHTDTATVNASSGVVTGIHAGTATISYSLFTGCKATKVVTVNVSPPAITGNPNVCIGSSVTLSNAMPGGTWTSSNTAVATVGSATGIVSSVTLGTSIITYTIPPNGCFASKMVTVQPLPIVYAVTGGGNHCAGASGVHIGLTGSQIGVSYVLYYGSSVTGYLAGTGFALDFGLLSPGGVYTVNATNVASGCMRNMSGSATVVVDPLVTPLVSVAANPNDTSCPGMTVLYSPASINGGTAPTYIWKVNGTLVSFAPSYSFIPANGDIISVAMTSNANCLATPTATGSLVMTVLPTEMPVVNVLVNPNDTICQYGVATYTAMPLFGGDNPTYKWLVNGAVAGIGSVYAYVPQQGDVVYCSMASDYWCPLDDTVETGNVSMYVDSLKIPHVYVYPDPGFFIEAGKPVTLHTMVTDAGPNPKYQWKVNGSAIAGATLADYTAIFHDYDSITCVVVSSGVCANIGTHDWVFITTTPLTTPQQAGIGGSIQLVPNPNRGVFTIKGSLGSINDEQVSVEVTDMLGQVVYTGQLNAKKGNVDEMLSVGNTLANGMYMLNLNWGEGQRVFHFVIRQ